MGKQRAPSRWLDAAAAGVITVSAAVGLWAVSQMSWASRLDDLGRATFVDGPTVLLAWAGVVSAALSLVLVVARRRWLRWVLLGTSLLTAGAAVAVCLSSIYDANTTNLRQSFGVTETAIASGAVVGGLAAVVIVLVASVGLLTSYAATYPTSSPIPMAASNPNR